MTAQRIPWQRRWYPMHYGCPRSVSEGLPGPGTILEAGGTHDFWEPVHLSVVQNHPNARVEYGVSESASTGRMEIRRYAFVSGGPKTLTVEPGFRTAEISPPAPFSGTGRFERTEHAHGTWLGDLSVEFPDYSQLRLSGSSFEAILHSGFREESIGGP